jgi:hypothetical protein
MSKTTLQMRLYPTPAQPCLLMAHSQQYSSTVNVLVAAFDSDVLAAMDDINESCEDSSTVDVRSYRKRSSYELSKRVRAKKAAGCLHPKKYYDILCTIHRISKERRKAWPLIHFTPLKKTR